MRQGGQDGSSLAGGLEAQPPVRNFDELCGEKDGLRIHCFPKPSPEKAPRRRKVSHTRRFVGYAEAVSIASWLLRLAVL
jgi:hypothetical protein